MFSESADLYDIIYSEFKDYTQEIDKILELLRVRCPSAKRLLDVGCGTGRHAALLSERGYQVDGLDIESAFVEIARKRCPEGRFFRGDMASFDLGESYDGVLCLFSSIGYVRTPHRLTQALRSIRRHLVPDGMAVVEPWLTPEAFKGGSVYLHTVDREDLKICRVSRSEVRGRESRLEFQYLVAEAREIRHLEEIHELGLFTQEEMLEAFREGGFPEVEYDPEGLTGRGLYLAKRPTAG